MWSTGTKMFQVWQIFFAEPSWPVESYRKQTNKATKKSFITIPNTSLKSIERQRLRLHATTSKYVIELETDF